MMDRKTEWFFQPWFCPADQPDGCAFPAEHDSGDETDPESESFSAFAFFSSMLDRIRTESPSLWALYEESSRKLHESAEELLSILDQDDGPDMLYLLLTDYMDYRTASQRERLTVHLDEYDHCSPEHFIEAYESADGAEADADDETDTPDA